MNQTVIFSAPMKSIVFSPYWNIPKSILNKEILPGIEKHQIIWKNTIWNGMVIT
jgi:murein L,D-transpeptidase YcbB/YkuD